MQAFSPTTTATAAATTANTTDLYTINSGNMDVPELPEIDPNFEPQQRARSNTWPLRPQEFVEKEPENKTTVTATEESPENVRQDPLGLNKKTSSRRNAWGNLSYADLITKAIQSSPEQRLTLSQIYDWMVTNVPYFKDKGDSNSSAGWKNSIRHNLSLHSRFVRVQNEGTGKSSWWVINPEAKPGKSPRRRATSMDTKTYEKKRGRVKKKVEALRAGNSPSGSDFGEGNELLEDPSLHYNLSPQDFRQRTSSNASSIGRLSPIPAVEPDLHDSQVPPMSPIPWGDIPASYASSQDQFTDSLQSSLANMMVGDQSLSPLATDVNDDMMMAPQSNGLGFQATQGLMSPPPPYPDANLRRSPQPLMGNSLTGLGGMNGTIASLVSQSSGLTNGMSGGSATFMTQALDVLQSDSMYAQEAVMAQDPLMSLTGELNQQQQSPQQQQQRNTSNSAVNQFGGISANSAFQSQSLRALTQQPPGGNAAATARQQFLQRQVSAPRQQTDSLLRQALTQQKQQNSSLFQLVSQNNNTPQPVMVTAPATPFSSPTPVYNPALHASLQQQQQQQQPMLPSDFTEIALNELKDGGIECDMEQIINQELTLEGTLDFNFDNLTAGATMPNNCADLAFGSMRMGQT